MMRVGSDDKGRSDVSIEDRVLRLVSRQLSIQGHKLLPTSRLDVNLGMAGDDAHEFIDAYEAEFGVDMSEPRLRSSEFFYPEVAELGVRFFLLIFAILAAASFILAALKLPGWLAAILSLAAVVLFLNVLSWANSRRERRHPRLKQITVAELIKAAKDGHLELND